MVVPMELHTLAPDVSEHRGNIKITQQCNQYYIYVQSESERVRYTQSPASGLMKRAERAKARNTIPPMMVTVRTEIF